MAPEKGPKTFGRSGPYLRRRWRGEEEDQSKRMSSGEITKRRQPGRGDRALLQAPLLSQRRRRGSC